MFRTLAELSGDLICRIGPDRPVYFSPACEMLFGWTQAELMQMRPEAFFVPEDMTALIASTGRLYSGASTVETCEVRVTRKDGSIAWVETNSRLAEDPTGRGPGDLIVVMRDITERKQRETRLAELALTDALTGLANRRVFDEALEQAWQDTVARESVMSLLLIDIDHFKKFNDAFGHQAGDDCLRAVAAALCYAIRRPATIARFGGEEFAVILPDTDAATARQIAEAARQCTADLAVAHPCPGNSAQIVTISIGTSCASAAQGFAGTMPGALVEAADRALYAAKRGGRNRVESAAVLASALPPAPPRQSRA